MLKTSMHRGIMGIAGANLLSPLIALIISSVTDDFSGITITQYILFTLSSSMIGFSFAAASVFFQMESFSRLKATVLHFVCLITSYFVAGMISGWIVFDKRILITITSFLVSYAISFFSIIIGLKINENKINEALLKKREERII